MNQDNDLSRDRKEITHRLVAAARSYGVASDMFDDAFGQLLGINRTDARCLDIVQRFGRMTAGHLAEESGLTTGAVTAALDRLEEAGYLRRERDSADRRKVFVELTELSKALGEIVFEPISRLYGEAMRHMPESELLIIARYLELGQRIHRDHTEIVSRYIPEGESDGVDRIRRARNYSRAARRLSSKTIEDWQSGREPANAFVSGKASR
jgi:DNA-binding MarR family transcriptional regulator